MQSHPQIWLHEMAPPLSSSGGMMIQRDCTDYCNCLNIADKPIGDVPMLTNAFLNGVELPLLGGLPEISFPLRAEFRGIRYKQALVTQISQNIRRGIDRITRRTFPHKLAT